MDETTDLGKVWTMLRRDPAVSIMFAIALLLIPLLVFAGAHFARSGHTELLFAALLLTGAFSVAGMVFGAMRGLRSPKGTGQRRG